MSQYTFQQHFKKKISKVIKKIYSHFWVKSEIKGKNLNIWGGGLRVIAHIVIYHKTYDVQVEFEVFMKWFPKRETGTKWSNLFYTTAQYIS